MRQEGSVNTFVRVADVTELVPVNLSYLHSECGSRDVPERVVRWYETR